MKSVIVGRSARFFYCRQGIKVMYRYTGKCPINNSIELWAPAVFPHLRICAPVSFFPELRGYVLCRERDTVSLTSLSPGKSIPGQMQMNS